MTGQPQTEKLRCHYVPKFLLRRIRDEEGLWRFNIHTGSFKRASIHNAAPKRGFYTSALEQGLLQEIDSRAAEVFHRGLIEKRQIIVDDQDKVSIARWLALFATRTPKTFESIKESLDKEKSAPSLFANLSKSQRREILQILEQGNPEAYRNLRDEFDTKEQFESFLLDAERRRIEKNPSLYIPDPQQAFSSHIENNQRIEDIARRLLAFQWVWMESKSGFVIGDNPLCRWSRSNRRLDYGIKHKDVEITIPLTRTITLRLQRKQSGAKEALICNRQTSEQYNARQTISAHEAVFGARRVLLPIARRAVKRALETGRLESEPRDSPLRQ